MTDQQQLIDQLKTERNRLATEIYCMHNDSQEGATYCIKLMRYGQEAGHNSILSKTLDAYDINNHGF